MLAAGLINKPVRSGFGDYRISVIRYSARVVDLPAVFSQPTARISARTFRRELRETERIVLRGIGISNRAFLRPARFHRRFNLSRYRYRLFLLAIYAPLDDNVTDVHRCQTRRCRAGHRRLQHFPTPAEDYRPRSPRALQARKYERARKYSSLR